MERDAVHEESEDVGRLPRVQAERHDVLAVLRRHGMSGSCAAAIWATARDLIRRTRRRGIEHAATLDTGDATPVGPILTGSATSTDMSPHLRAFRSDRNYVLLHTHPNSTSFSPLDVRMR